MKNNFSNSLLNFFVVLIFISCDSTLSPNNKLTISPAILNVSLSPESVQFENTDGFKDTTVVLQLYADIQTQDVNIVPGYVVRDKSSLAIIQQGELNLIDSDYTADINIQTSTTAFEQYIVEVFIYNNSGNGNYFQSPFSISGFSNNPPEILSTSSPGTITRPSSGSTPAVFTATVTDADGDHTIDRVFLRVIDQTAGEVTGSPFDMADDGVSLRDTTANDFTYTWSLDVPGNPDSGIINRDYDIEFFALDQGGLYSDTVRTTFSIRGN